MNPPRSLTREKLQNHLLVSHILIRSISLSLPLSNGSFTAARMKTIATASILRPATIVSSCHPVLLPLAARRTYATPGGSSSASKRRSVTPFNDDGHVPWSQLSGAEKTARAAQQSFNFGFILVGVGLTGVVGYFLFTDVFSTESKTTYFNRAVDRIRKDHRCLELLGEGKKIRAHGEETHNRWARSRPIASTERTDPQGNHHLLMHFYVSAYCFLSVLVSDFITNDRTAGGPAQQRLGAHTSNQICWAK